MKKGFILSLVVVVVLVLSGCTARVPESSVDIDTLMLECLEDVENDDMDAYLALFHPDYVSDDEAYLGEYWGMVRAYYLGEMTAWERLPYSRETSQKIAGSTETVVGHLPGADHRRHLPDRADLPCEQ